MSLPLKDFRLGITDEIHAALEARADANNTDMQSVARDVLAEWAAREAHAYTVYARRVMSNGMQAELPGIERSGTAARGRR